MTNQRVKSLGTALEQFAQFPYLRKLLLQEDFGNNVNILAIGKSAFEMAQVACEVLRIRSIGYEGYLLTKYGHAPEVIDNLILCEAGHPLPDANSIHHSRSILGWLASLPPEEDIIILLSGGGSALFELPEGRTDLDDIIELNKYLLNSGLSIAEMNAERRKLSRVKGGKALRYIACMRVFCYALSDVAGNDPTVIASAPFYTPLARQLSPVCYKTPIEDNLQYLAYHIIGDNLSFLHVLAESLGGSAIVHEGFVTDSADNFAEHLLTLARQSEPNSIHLFGGEVTITPQGTGKGGRCTHIALDFAIRIAGLPNISLITYATDGSDYISGVAGAIVNGQSVQQMKERGIIAKDFLVSYDSFSALNSIGGIILSYPYHTNVNDVSVLIL